MRRISSLFIALIIAGLCFCHQDVVVKAEDDVPSRTINLVYDDSGSMIYDYDAKKKVDTWCKAKYAVEVFAAMLGENDSMNLYVMSDFDSKGASSHKKKMTLKGSDGAENNVKKIHDMVTDAGDTPFDSVRTALSDLKGENADEKWLVVLTDGEFEDGNLSQEEMDKTFASKPEDVSVMFLGMGPDAGKIKENKDEHIYYAKAKDNEAILKELTGIGEQVFNRAHLSVSKKNTISFDVPMKELIIFAQGPKVEIKGINDTKGKTIAKAEDPVVVRYSTKASTTGGDYTDPIIDKNLRGSVATFDGTERPFKAGTYALDIGGEKTVDVYYSPDVDVIMTLKDPRSGKKVDIKDPDLKAGNYELDFALVDKTTGKRLPKSDLLGDISYEATVTNNGKTHEQTYTRGDEINIQEGDLSVDATAHYLGYHTVDTHMEKGIFQDKKITFAVEDDPGHIVTGKGFKDGAPLRVKAVINGDDFTDKQWQDMGVPIVTVDDETKVTMGPCKVKKSSEPGIFEITPTLPEKLEGKTYSDVNLNLAYSGNSGKAQWKGKGTVPMKITDERSWITRNRELIIKGLISLLFLLLLAGLLLKRTLPKRLKANPTITIMPLQVGYSGGTDKGKVEKTSRWIPFVPQKGTIRYYPRSVRGLPKLRVKAVGGNKMEITNMSSFAGKSNITFNGNPIEKDQKKPMRTGAGLTIEVTTAGRKYTCILNN